MKKIIARILFLVIILSSFFALVGCSFKLQPKWRSLNSLYMVTISDVEQQETIDFEIAKLYYLDIRLFGDVAVDDDTYKDIQIEYNGKTTVVEYGYDSPRTKRIRFYVYLYEFGNNDTLKITYRDKSVEVGYNVVDFDFESKNWITPTSIDDLDAFPEFKEMLLSIKRHEFKEPYKGLTSYSYSTYWDNGYWFYDLADKNDTGYLEYLTDSVYYPSTIDLVEENRVANREAYMSFTGREKVQPGASRSVMDYFIVGYSVIDPGCTHPQNPLHSLLFSATKKEDWKHSLIDEGDYPAPISVLLEKYPERFFEYDLNGLKIHIRILGNSGVNAYFNDENYFYSMSASYDYD